MPRVPLPLLDIGLPKGTLQSTIFPFPHPATNSDLSQVIGPPGTYFATFSSKSEDDLLGQYLARCSETACYSFPQRYDGGGSDG
ncbi:unnamed protein product, partial [Iphiclides podalirius]